MPTLALQILSLLPQITTGIEHLWAFIRDTRKATRQTGEWTPEMEQAFQAALADRKNRPEYQTDNEGMA